jgi:YD repeat-containing protein
MKTIKSIYLMTLISSLIFLLEGCKKDEPAPVTQASLLVGSWKEVSYVATGCTDPKSNESSTCTTSCETLVITATTFKIVKADGSSQTFNYTAKDNTITVTLTGGQITTATFAITGSTLAITNQDSLADGNCKSVSTYSKI